MIRTQVQLTEEQAAVLRTMSAERGLPIAELIRLSIDGFLKREAGAGRDLALGRARSVAGRFASGASDIGAEHDRYLAEAFGRSFGDRPRPLTRWAKRSSPS